MAAVHRRDVSVPATPPSLAEALRVWLRIGFLSFGGPAGQIALMHREVVDERRWIGERRFLAALNVCTVLPGPEAQQLATWLGWIMHGVPGGLAAGILFVLPGAAVMLGLSLLYVLVGRVPVVSALFFGLACAVLALVLEALLRIARRALRGAVAWTVAAAAFAALFLLNLPFPVVIIAAALAGLLLPSRFAPVGHDGAAAGPPALIDAVLEADPGRPARLAAAARRAGLAALALWLVPVAALNAAGVGTYADIAWFFSKMAVVTFGGAYAVLAYVAQEAVGAYGWLSADEMLTGLALAETTPGPLILVLQFVGFLAGFRAPEALTGITGGVAASALVLWVSFAPCFAFVFLVAPAVGTLERNRALAGALAAVTAAAVGVIANLALWFSLRVLFSERAPVALGPIMLELPVATSLVPEALALAVLAAVCLFVARAGVVRMLAATAAAGVVLRLVF